MHCSQRTIALNPAQARIDEEGQAELRFINAGTRGIYLDLSKATRREDAEAACRSAAPLVLTPLQTDCRWRQRTWRAIFSPMPDTRRMENSRVVPPYAIRFVRTERVSEAAAGKKPRKTTAEIVDALREERRREEEKKLSTLTSPRQKRENLAFRKYAETLTVKSKMIASTSRLSHVDLLLNSPRSLALKGRELERLPLWMNAPAPYS
ncbi:hypothetical protein GUITHDRAFT_104881 [Guillardia theta CCMP2712]|uniref:Uncharacterized protein n=1 Tax=Guillardia theta (strain CCMP2712) TaxID=905079 RepID=L1JMA0_GUITC|nr:hypothetical protein GUITHDRAFT_104881 [Guillardia theta CCMP2712]EKX49354.1 hypothetical protein GUITHDRAFT_104881 [Guillardia theta CCMP2712]|eukprot:XP_005836334.1 hypothetical protein GUITHDRAFT_104881 [Guillardia theta CCMP2712]